MDTGLALEGVLFKYNTKFDSNGPNILPGAFDSCDGKTVPLSCDFFGKHIGSVTFSTHDDAIYFTAFVEYSEDSKKEIEILKSGNGTFGFFVNKIKYDDTNKPRNNRSIVSGIIVEWHYYGEKRRHAI